MSFEPPSTTAKTPAPEPGRAQSSLSAWLTLVGVGADGVSGLAPAARRAIECAELVLGSTRQLQLVRPILRGTTLTWPSPFSEGLRQLLARRGLPTCVLASGDPFFYGVGSSLAPELEPGEFVCHPAPSSLSLAASRLGWALQDTELVSLHGRDLGNVLRALHPGRRILALSWNSETPAELARLLTERGFGPSRLHVLETLGGPGERCRSARASSFDLSEIGDLNLVAIEAQAGPEARWLPYRASLPDEYFDHDGQLTKQDVRAITLSALAPRPGARLWDVGAGSGSIAIEWLLCHPACRAIAIEREAARCERIRHNANALGAPQLELIQGSAPAALPGPPAPDAIFIGGGVSVPGVLEQCWDRLAHGGRIVVNAVSLEGEARLIALHGERGGQLRRIAIESAAPLGTMTSWRPALPIVQWRAQKT